MHVPLFQAHALNLSRIVAGFALLAVLSACGYKGPLTMPPPPPPPAEDTVHPPTMVPAPTAP